MERRITGFDRDDRGDWVALLDCLHRQHVRHRPPIWPRPWVLTADGRERRIGAALDCPRCDRCELPDDLVVVRTSATWDERTLPGGLRANHRLAARVWGRLGVLAGSLRFVAAVDPHRDVVLVAGDTQPIPPDVEHHVEVDGPVRCAVEFLRRPD